MNPDQLLHLAQVYRFLAGAFLYPRENWLEDLPDLAPILESLELRFPAPVPSSMDLEALQADYRHTLGLSGSMPYETEIGLPDEFRQSQEMADIAGFYCAFGFKVGGTVRERPDYLATELEFMGLLALKQAYAAGEGNLERVEICNQALISFLTDHLGRWIELFASALTLAAGGNADDPFPGKPYVWLARFAASFVRSEGQQLGVDLKTISIRSAIPTPVGPELSCESCPAVS